MVEVNGRDVGGSVVEQFKQETGIVPSEHASISHIDSYGDDEVSVFVANPNIDTLDSGLIRAAAEAGWAVVFIEFEFGEARFEAVE